MVNRRILLHIAFWLGYTGLYTIINMGFAPPSDMEYPWLTRLGRFWLLELIELPVKLMATYGFFYFILPKTFSRMSVGKLILWSMLGLVPLLFLNRYINYYVLFPTLYNEFPSYELISLRRLMAAFLDIFPAVALASTIKLIMQRMEGQKREQELVKEKLQSELNFLKAQMNPHFLFNTLNNIYSLARKGSDRTADVVMGLSKILRYMLYDCQQPTVSLSQEINMIKDYIELEKIRYNDRLVTSFEVNVDEESTQIAPLLLIPFVENAFKHGVSETRFTAQVNVRLVQANGRVSLVVKNSIETGSQSDDEGIGLKNVMRQLELIYQNRHHLTFIRENDSFSVNLNIQLHE